MSLEDVKVGDRVMVHFKGEMHLEHVKYVGIKTFRTDARRSYYKSTGCHSNGGKWAEHYYTAHTIATNADIAAAREREQAREEKRERLAKLYNVIMRPLEIDRTEQESRETVTFEFENHRYEIREVAAHREE